MTLLVALLIGTCVATGAGFTYLSGVRLLLEERVAYGTVIGLMVTVLVAVPAGWIFDFGSTSVWVAAIGALALSGIGWYRSSLGADWQDFVGRIGGGWRDPGNPLPLLLLLIPSWIVAVRILSLAYTTNAEGDVFAGHLAVFSDWQAHLAYTSSFAEANNVGFDLTLASGNDLTYHVGINYLAAMFVPLGASLTSALTISSGILAFAFPAIMYLVGVRIFSSRAVGMLATLLFTMFGGLGFLRFAGDVADQGIDLIWDIHLTYTRDPSEGWWIENPVIGNLYPQRPTLFGFSITLIVIGLLWAARRNWTRRTFACAGVLVGLAPFFHLFGFGTSLALGLIWAVMDRRREWLWFVVPALVVALPFVIWMLPESSDSADWFFNWVSEVSDDDHIRFWVKNLGLFLPLLLIAQFWRAAVPKAIAVASLPIWLWFLIPNAIKPHPWEGNNTHYFVFVLLLGSFLVAAVLVALVRRFRVLGAAAALLMAFSLTATGAVDLWTAMDSTTGVNQIMTGSDQLVAEWAIEETPADAIFVIGPTHRHPLPALGGRTVVTAFSGWVFDLGIPDWFERAEDSRTILAGDEGYQDLLGQYGVDYVVVGPYEINDFGANAAFWRSVAKPVYDFGGYTVYEVAQG
jgi:hypothetical protein